MGTAGPGPPDGAGLRRARPPPLECAVGSRRPALSLVDPAYLVFLAAVYAGLRLAGGGRAGLFVLLGASALFYASWNPLYLVPLLVVATTDYLVTRRLARTRGRAARRALVGVSLVVDLSLLAGFKYGSVLAAAAWPILRGPSSPGVELVLAAGISFYTFQSLSCVVDVFRGEQEPAGSFAEYLAFVSFFPTLLAGPITRAETLFPQLSAIPPAPSDDAGSRAAFLIALGFAKKCLVADPLALNLVNRVFEVPGMFTSAEAAVGVYGFAVQVWADFSGYSDIAIGSALLLGFRVGPNFDQPYRSRDLAEFWRRWHISLSTWLRDYVFFSLPGNRRGTVAPYFNIVVTFVLGGLWHGSTWTFALWGLMHGAGLAAVRLWSATRRSRPRLPVPEGFRAAIGTALTFHFVLLTWIPFRCARLEDARELLRVLLQGTGGLGNVPAAATLALAVGLLAHFLPLRWLEAARERFVVLPVVAQAAVLLLFAGGVRLAASAAPAKFIYFAF